MASVHGEEVRTSGENEEVPNGATAPTIGRKRQGCRFMKTIRRWIFGNLVSRGERWLLRPFAQLSVRAFNRHRPIRGS